MDLQELQIDRRRANPRRARRRGPAARLWALAAVAVLALAVWLFGPALQRIADRLRLPEVRTAVVRPPAPAAAAAVRGTAANGYVVAARRAALSSDVPGRIVEMRVTEGSVVRRGDVVARLYSDEYRAALERAEADRKVAEAEAARAQTARSAAEAEEEQSRENQGADAARLVEARAQQAFAAAEFRRMDDLVQQGIRSPRELEQAQSLLEAADARVEALAAALRASEAAARTAALRVQVAADELVLAEARVQSAAAAVEQARAALDKTDVRAPFDGIVVLKDAEVGEVVSPNVVGGSTARGAVCTMVDFDSLEVQAHVPENALGAVQVGAPASVFLDAFPDRRLRGRVDRIWPTADRQKATVEVRIVLAGRDEALRPEMGVRIVFERPTAAEAGDAGGAAAAGEVAAALLVPESSLVEAAGRTGAFVVEQDTVRFVELSVGERRAGQAAVETGLRAGQVLVLEPPPGLRDGDRIRIAGG